MYMDMYRTTVMLPIDLKTRAVKQAREMKISLGEFIRECLAAALRPSVSAARDPLLADREVFKGPSPSDLAKNHDQYLYG
ncbi:MAG: hypothetical protein HY747_11440 [Elusimicrobia bacterium]|nr:hypothetical protein [Elusimicrobiota bacterium]